MCVCLKYRRQFLSRPRVAFMSPLNECVLLLYIANNMKSYLLPLLVSCHATLLVLTYRDYLWFYEECFWACHVLIWTFKEDISATVQNSTTITGDCCHISVLKNTVQKIVNNNKINILDKTFHANLQYLSSFCTTDHLILKKIKTNWSSIFDRLSNICINASVGKFLRSS